MVTEQSDGSIILTVKIDQKQLNQALTNMSHGADAAAVKFTKLGKIIGSAFVTGALVKFGKESVQLASDLEEVQNVVDVAFGEMKYKMEDFAKTSIETLGMSKLAAKQTGSSYMAMADGMGIAKDEASDMALTLTALSADMASFYNMRQEETKTALSAVFTGETESLKRYGIAMTEVNLQEYARQQGITKSISKMTQQEKVMLRYQYIMSVTKNAQGDFARTQDSFANKTRVLSEKWKEFQTVMGETIIVLADAFLPVIETCVEVLTVLGLTLSAFVNGLRGIRVEEEATTEQTKQLNKGIAATIAGINKTTSNMNKLENQTKKTNRQLAQFDDLMILASDTSESGSLGEDAFSGAIDTEYIDSLTNGVRAIDSVLSPEVMKKINGFQNAIADNKEVVGATAAGIALTGLGLKIATLLGWFTKKDEGLDTQKGKWDNETSSVTNLSDAFGLIPFVTLLDNLGDTNDELDSTEEKLRKAKERAGELSPAFADISDAITGKLIPAFDKLEKPKSLVEGLQTAVDNLKNSFGKAKEEADNFGKDVPVAIESAEPKVSFGFKTMADEGLRLISAFNKSRTESEAFDRQTENTRARIAATLPEFTELDTGYATAVRNAKENGIELKSSLDTASVGFSDMFGAVDGIVATYGDAIADKINKVSAAIATDMKISSENMDTNFGGALDSMFGNAVKFFMAFASTGSAQDLTSITKTKFKASTFKGKNASGFVGTALALAAIVGKGIATAYGIPALATGGIVPHATTALIGERGAEAVLPLERNTQWMDILADKIASRSQSTTTSSQPITLVLNDREFGRAVIESGNRESKRIGVRTVLG